MWGWTQQEGCMDMRKQVGGRAAGHRKIQKARILNRSVSLGGVFPARLGTTCVRNVPCIALDVWVGFAG